jgi:hypothetical protein
MGNILAGIPHQINIADDILIAGSMKEHDQALELVLTRLQDNGMTVNTKKCQFDVEETPFIGLIFNKKGIQPDPTKVEALHVAVHQRVRKSSNHFWAWQGIASDLSLTMPKLRRPFENC